MIVVGFLVFSNLCILSTNVMYLQCITLPNGWWAHSAKRLLINLCIPCGSSGSTYAFLILCWMFLASMQLQWRPHKVSLVLITHSFCVRFSDCLRILHRYFLSVSQNEQVEFPFSGILIGKFVSLLRCLNCFHCSQEFWCFGIQYWTIVCVSSNLFIFNYLVY